MNSQNAAMNQLQAWDLAWAEEYSKMATNPWVNGVLDIKTIELICIGLNAACTNLQADATRHHIRAALESGASRDEIFMVLQMASMLSIHSCSLGAPILLEEAKASGVAPTAKQADTPACDQMKGMGQWNVAWEPFYHLDPVWTDQFMASAIGIYASEILTPKVVELLSIAFDASITHMYAPGTRRHIKSALALGTTMEEIMEVLKVCVSFGGEACRLAVPILAEELAAFEQQQAV